MPDKEELEERITEMLDNEDGFLEDYSAKED